MQLQTQTKVAQKPSFTPVQTSLLQRKCACGQHTAAGGECEECRQKHEGMMQRAAVSPSSVNSVPPIVHEVLSSPGQSLDTGTRAFMEPRFGHDFSYVRVHTDEQAAESAQVVKALAYTVGRDVVFGEGQYRPGTNDGQGLLAHELTHVVQQRGLAHQGEPIHLGNTGGAAEKEAEAVAMGHSATTPLTYSHGVLQRSGKSGGGAGLCGGTWKCAAPSDCATPDKPGNGKPSTSWKLTTMIDIEAPSAADVTIKTPGHTYVEFTESNGATYTYGFYPKTSTDPLWKPNAPGCVVHPDTAHTTCVDYRESFTLTEADYEKALKFAQGFCTGPLAYNLLTQNCTTFVVGVVRAAGKSLPPVRGKVAGKLDADNPNTLIDALRARDAARSKDAGTTKDAGTP